MQKSQISAEAFLTYVSVGQLDDAYGVTAPAFQQKVSREQFQTLIGQYPAFTKQTRRSLGGMRIFQQPNGRRAFFQYSLVGPNNSLALTLVLVRVGQEWKIESINLP